MAPTLRHGDALLVRRGARVRPGDLVIARFPAGPAHLVVKRAVRAYGPAEVLGRVLLRYWPPRRLPPAAQRSDA